MSNTGKFDLQHEYAPSVVATYLAASSLITTVEGAFYQEQNLSLRYLHFWFNAFSAAVSMPGYCLFFEAGVHLYDIGYTVTAHLAGSVECTCYACIECP